MRPTSKSTSLMLVDVQENLFYRIEGHVRIEQRLHTLVQGLQCLSVPILCHQQYTQGLGETIASLKVLLGNGEVYEKKSFSCCQNPNVCEMLRAYETQSVIVAGVEAHVCVLQTALDLKEKGFDVIVCTDAIGSRYETDCETALKRMAQEGIFLTTVESILFELLGTAEHAEFKAISRLVKER